VTTHILVVEDDKKTAETLRLYLEHAGHEVTLAFNGAQGLEEAARVSPDLVVLDLMLPRVDGLAVCRRLRERTSVPVIMLTARTTEDDTLTGLAAGADDYVHKPFSPRELTARIATVLRRARTRGPDDSPSLHCGSLVLDRRARAASRNGDRIALTPREYRLLETFMREPGRAFTRDELLDRAFDDPYEGSDRTVDAHIKNLRQKVETDPSSPRLIITVFGVGYRFDGTVE
jgi:DNA-binding response OmpR family regulator